jgi:hypothetical protein
LDASNNFTHFGPKVSKTSLELMSEKYPPMVPKAYLSGISYYIKSNGFEDVTQFFIIQKMMRGMFRLDKRNAQLNKTDS